MDSPFVIQFENADIFVGDVPVLNKVNFTLAKAESCYIIGKSGSGKTSFLKAIYGNQKVGAGVARVGDFDLTSIKKHQIPMLRRSLGMVFQDFILFEDWTVGKNLLFVLEATGWKDVASMKGRVLDVLQMVGLQGYEKRPIKLLSGGEQQRVVIARALLNNPSVIIADEPTGNLDPDTSDDILYLLSRLTREFGTSTIVATHDYRLLDKFPARVYKCFDGKLTEVSHK
ncbi:MAG: ATP-binding cassette domain-containing protein [Saprospiraceae bacterium]|nr:ATP-binding cassette domain-containing protein [Saprospiraceae bacterium]MCB9308528.1 ATP-binding cassette domain-containing protein [Lewinellaceae bacterium]